MEPQDLNYLLNKYSRTPTSGRTEELYPEYSPRSSFSPFRDPNSKAYAAAMRALQERIRFIESENSNLYEKYQLSESKLQEERRLSEKLTKDLHAVTSSEQFHNISNADLKQELSRAKKEISGLQKLLQSSNNPDLLDLQQENLHLKTELDQALREAAANKSHEIALKMELRKLEEEKYLVQEELAKEKWRSQEVQDENKELQGAFETFKHKDHAESELKRQNEQFVRTIKDLENRCRYLEDAGEPRSPVSRLYQDEGKQSKTSKKSVSFRKSRSKSRTSKSPSPNSPRLSRPQNRHIGAHLMESGEFTDKINRMETEMGELNKKYRRLLHASKSETNGLGKLRSDIENLATELENKGNQLYNLKKQQQKSGSDKKETVY